MRTDHCPALLHAALVVLFGSATAWAVPYASGVRNTGANTWEFILNEAADTVTVLRDGGNPLNLGGLSPGRHTFDMSGFNDFEIQVAKSASVGWTMISDHSNPFTHFTIPSGVAINTDPSSPFFGTLYVAQASSTTTISGRPMGEGVYPLTADLIGVDLTTFAAIGDPNDTSQAKSPGTWATTGSGTASPWRMVLDEAGNLIVSDWSDAHGGIKWATPDLTDGGPLLRFQDGIRPLFEGQNGEVHGSIASKAYVTGSVGNNLTVSAMDEDFDLDGETLITAATGNHIWRWDVGDVTNYDNPPSLVINSSNVGDGWLDLNVGVRAGAHYSPQHNKWYLVQNRFDGNQTGLVVITPDGIDGNSPTREWSSLEWSVENNLDGNTGLDGIQDVFRQIGDVTLSPDGTKVLIHKIAFGGGNNVWSLDMGAVMIIPLDENGIPDVQVDTETGTLSNVETILLIGNNGAHSSGAQMEFDAAGNLYVANSAASTTVPANHSQSVQVFSPGGSWLATTTSDGQFSLQALEPPVGLPGDYNQDGIVDAADYTLWRDSVGTVNTLANDPIGGTIGQAQYDQWKQNFGNIASGAVAGAVPEPSALLLALVGMIGLAAGRRRVSA